MKKTTYTLSQAIALDAERKMALDQQFFRFYTRFKESMKARPELRELNDQLEAVKDSVQAAAYGHIFGIPMVEVEEPENWEEAANPKRQLPKR